jgi:phosphate transport system protein
MSADLERMGDLSHHIAKIARLRHPEVAVPQDLHDIVRHMGDAATKIAEKVGTVIETRNTSMALELEKDDDVIDTLHRELIGKLTSGSWDKGVASAVDMTLLGRYYERFADHAVSVSRRVYFLVTGEFAPA